MTVLTLIFSISIANEAYGQSAELKKTVDTIFKLSKDKSYDQAEKYFYNSAADSKRLAKKINAFLTVSDSYAIESSKSTPKGDIEEHVVSIAFKSGDRKLNADFIFVKANNKFLLKDIN